MSSLGHLYWIVWGLRRRWSYTLPVFFSFSDMFWHFWLLPSIAYNYTGSYRYFAIEIASILPRQCTEQCHGGQPGHLPLNAKATSVYRDVIGIKSPALLEPWTISLDIPLMSTDSAAETSMSGVLLIIPTLWCIMVYICWLRVIYLAHARGLWDLHAPICQ